MPGAGSPGGGEGGGSRSRSGGGTRGLLVGIISLGCLVYLDLG